LLAAFVLSRLLQTFLFETAPTDAATFATFALVIALAAMLAAFMPARVATRVNPVSALRAE
jgi:ABC-type antimicrobial peptide transport system permease subunit